MNWKDIAGTVGKAAPMLGTLLGGPAGGAVGGLVAHALGVESKPDQVAEAMKADPEAAVKLQRMELENERELRRMSLESETARLSEVNQTMRAEYQAEGNFKTAWRPFIGWVFGLGIGGLIGALIGALVTDPTVVSDPEFTGLLVWLFGSMAAVLGVNIRERSKDKQTAQGIQPKSLIDAFRR